MSVKTRSKEGVIADSAENLSIVFGFMRPAEVDLVKHIAKNIKMEYPIFVNIGAGVGTSGMAMAEARPEAILYTIDIIWGDTPFGGLGNERNVFDMAKMKYPHQILGDSVDIAKRWRSEFCDDFVDFLFVDGDHSDAQVTKEIIYWYPNMAKNSIIAFHDYHNDIIPTVIRPVNTMIRDKYKVKPLYEVETMVVFQVEPGWEWEDIKATL